jgi:hypothetical protein
MSEGGVYVGWLDCFLIPLFCFETCSLGDSGF